MKISTLGLFLGGALLVSGAGIAVTACSSDSGTGNPTTNPDSSTGNDGSSHNDGQAQQDTGMMGDDGGSDTGTGAECGTTPTVHPSDGGPGAIYCPFGPDGGAIHCNPASETCCINPKVNGTFPPSTCSATCPYSDAGGATDLHCQDSISCSANGKGNICCGSGPLPTLDTACGYYNEKGLKAGNCEQGPSCAAGEFQLCGGQNDCPTGKTCTAFKAKGMQLGFCM